MEMSSSGLLVLLWIVCRFYSTHGITLSWVTPAEGQSVSKSEDLAINSVVLTLNAGTPASGISYSFVSPQPGEFSITGTNGDELQLVSALDYETTASYSITLRATETAVPANTADVTFTIVVVNVNDNGPVLQATSTSINVKEGTASAITLATITHTDADTDTGMIEATYVLTSGDGGYFTLVGGDLQTTSTPTDYATTSSFTLLITGTDTNNNALTGTITISITITTEPTFTLPASGGSTKSIAENAAATDVVFTFAVSDADGAPSAVTTTFTGDGSLFEILGSALVVKSGAVFDFETTTQYTVTFDATDGLYDVNSDTLTISITDVNEAPVYDTNTPTSAVVQATTSTGDAVDGFLAPSYVTDPEGDTIQYSLSGTSLLAIDSSTGALTTAAAIVYDTGSPTFTAIITASDGTLSASHTVIFNVKTAPVITLPLQAVELNEDSVNPDSVYTFAATDEDGDSAFTFTIDSQSVAGTFVKAGDDTGIIVASGTTFDYDNGLRSYTVTIQCADLNSFTSTAELTVNIVNVNDENPIFTSSSADVSVAENLVPGNGDTLYTAAATDDFNTALTYAITAGNTGDVFSIDASSGVVVLQNAVSYATLSSYTLVFTVTDTPLQTATLSVNFNVKTAPMFTSGTTATTDENTAATTSIYGITTSDADGDTNPTYTIASQSVAGAFGIDGTNLVVSTSASLDYESLTEHTVVLNAEDSNGIIGSVTVTVGITNVNDEAPVFTSSAGPIDIAINTATATSVYQAVATDDAASVTYTITSGNDAGLFAIDANSGDITTTAIITDSTAVSLVITASDSVFATTLTVAFVIRTVPSLTLPANQNIDETLSVGSVVQALVVTDADGDTGHTVTIVSQTPETAFQISGTNIVTTTTFDFETGTTSFTLLLRVEDDYPMSSDATLTITITDENDEIPVFTDSSYTATIKENLLAHDFLLASATDADNGDIITYSLDVIPSPPVVFFEIHATTGQLSTNAALTYDSSNPTINILLKATDGTGHEGTSPLVVTVIEETDVAFVNPSPDPVSIPEDSASGMPLIDVSATDADGDTLTFVFTANGDKVSMTNTGTNTYTISTSTTFDFETVTTPFEVIYTVTDENNPPFVASATLTVAITDVNDNPPVFSPLSYTASLQEHVDTAVVTVAATDDDSSLNDNNVIAYSITGGNDGNIFSIDSSTGVITAVASGIDYATATEHTLVVTANDLNGAVGALSATANVVVSVETAPAWTEPEVDNKQYSVSENIATAGSIIQLGATDADGVGVVSYSITSQTPSSPADLIVFSTTGLLVRGATSFDREAVSPITSVTLALRVTDGAYSTDVNIVVNIQDENDETPVFQQASYTFTVPETAAVGQSVGTVIATDNDFSEAFRDITYSLTGTNSADFIMSTSVNGQIEVAASLIGVAVPYSLTVAANDGINEGTATLTVTIVTEPVWSEPGSDNKNYYMDEDAVSGDLILTLAADDTDNSPSALVYSIESETPSIGPTASFVVNSATGQISRGAIDFDYDSDTAVNQVTLAVRVTDGQFPKDRTIIININDVNDIAPVFSPDSYSFQVSENAAPGTSVGIVTATDDDVSTQFNTISYSLSGTNSAHFSIDSTGKINVVGSLIGVATPYTLTVTATDSLLSDTSTVTITVKTDPVWTLPAATGSIVNINEDISTGASVYQLDAGDADGDALTYSIESVTPAIPTNAFVLSDTVTGQINVGTTVLDVDLSSISNSYTLAVRVTDGTTPVDSSLVINIADLNDNLPIFAPTSYTFDINDQIGIGSSVGVVTATDNDLSSQFNTLTYVLSGDNSGHFVMSSDVDGQINTAISMQNAPTPYSLTVTVSDTTNTATASVAINVKTVPVWTLPAATGTIVNINEDISTGASVYQLDASDADGDALTYSIESVTPAIPTNAFVLSDTVTGQINVGTTALDVDLSSISNSYTLAVRVTDGTTPVDSSLVINIADLNDNLPIFAPTSYTFDINDQIGIGSSVGVVTATDNDLSSQFNTLTYVLSGDNSGHFVMSSDVDGQINTAISMQNAQTPYSLTVTVSDTTNTATTSVAINVKTVPQFTQPPTDAFEKSVDENTASNLYLLQSVDTDGDTQTYTILSQTPSTPAGLFVLSSSVLGQIDIGVGQTLDYDSNDIEETYTLGVRVSDGTTDVDSSVVIRITDLNDESPTFTLDNYQFTVSESAISGSSVGTITATDDDINSAFNGITYSLSGTGSPDFELTNTGQINVNAQLDHGTTSTYTLTATASDSLNEDTAVIVISVKTAPEWTSPDSAASVTVAENIDSTHVFYQIDAADADGDSLTFSIKSQTVTDFFVLGGTSGKDVLMNTGKVLDFEANQLHTLTFEVTDGTNAPVLSAQLEITVTDENDNNPVFSASSLNIYVKDTTQVGATVTTLSASDADSSTNNNNVITYSITSGNANGDFALDSQGVLTLVNAYSIGDSDTIVVQATDGGTVPRTGQVTLIIAGTTPSSPVLTAPISSGATVSISETLAVGSSVYTIQASDSDGDSLIYSIVSPSPPPAEFRLADNVLQVKLALDYETTTSYQIVFEVDDDDGDTSNKLTSGTLTVTITNENDHFPTFSQEFHTVQVMEQQTDVIDVLQLTATDRDIGVAGDLTYSIVYGDHFGQFTVDSSGKLKTTNVALLYSKQRSVLLGIQAKDGGTPARADSTHVKVDVTVLTDQNGAMFLKWNFAVVVIPLICTMWKIIGLSM